MRLHQVAGWMTGGMLAGAIATAAIGQLAVPMGSTLKIDSARVRALRSVATSRIALPGLTRDQYVTRLRKAFDARDVNQDMVTSWQKPGSDESLPAFAQCVIVKYQTTAASKVKDAAHPGQFIETPAATIPFDWEYFLDRLAATKFDGGKCEAVKLDSVAQCIVGGKAVDAMTMFGWQTAANAGTVSPMCQSSLMSSKPMCAKQGPAAVCKAHGGSYESHDKMTGCEKYTTYGPDSTEALVRVAQASFDAEDWNKNGRIDGEEGAFLCPAT